MREIAFVAVALFAAEPALAAGGATINPMWNRALHQRYHAKDVGSTIDPHRYNQAQLRYLSAVVKGIDDRIASRSSYNNVLTATNMAFYMRARDVAFQMFDEEAPPFDGDSRGPMITGEPDDPLFQVNTGQDIAIDTEEETNWGLVRLSYDFVELYGRFRVAGYSHKVTQDALNRFESRRLQIIADDLTATRSGSSNQSILSDTDVKPLGGTSISEPLYAALTLELESRRLKYQPNKPRFIESDGLGAGGMDVAVRIIPNDGVAMRISRFDFLFCKSGRIDPFDRSKCNGWYAMRNGDAPNLSGNYEVFVSWPSGRTLHTNISVDKQQSVTFTAPR